MKKKGKCLLPKVTALVVAFAVSTTGISGNAPLFTQAASSSFSLTSKVTIGDGETFQLSAKGNTKGISFQSSNKKIVSVSKTGKIKGKKSGKTTIIAKVKKKTKKCTVIVKKAPKAVKILNGNLELYADSMEQLSVKFTDGYSKKVTFRSADKAVATVSSKGLVTAVGEGKTTITATTFNGKKAKISCRVIDDQKELATSTPTNTSEPSSTGAATGSAVPVTSVLPTETASVTEVPIDTPAAPTPTSTVLSTPGPTVDPEVTILPSNTPTADPIIEPSILPTASASVPEIVTTSAVVSKIENGTIYIDNDTAQLQLTSCICFYKADCKISMDEIFAGDTITITYSGMTQESSPAVLTECEMVEVTKSRSSLLSATTIRALDGNSLFLYDEHRGPLTYQPSVTKIIKDGKEISFEELKTGDTVRINSTYYESDNKEGAVGFCEILDTVVVLEDEFPDARTETGVIENILSSSTNSGNYLYITFGNGFYVAICDADTIVKEKGETLELATDKSALKVGQTITVSYMNQSYDMVPVWLSQCKKIVIDTTVSIATPPATTTSPTVAPTVSPSWPPVEPMKPVIYLYPEEETSVSVYLDFQGSFTYTYPYTEDGHWDVVAKPDGTLINKADGKEYSYLFWEGTTSHFTPDFSEGFCVKGEDTTEFLQKVLPQMGLTPKEYNEFIVYWAPLMQNNPYNLISFQTENYEDLAPLQVNPAPDSMLRVYMAYKPLSAPVTIPEQTFTPFERNGFAIVEWGGCVVK